MPKFEQPVTFNGTEYPVRKIGDDLFSTLELKKAVFHDRAHVTIEEQAIRRSILGYVSETLLIRGKDFVVVSEAV